MSIIFKKQKKKKKKQQTSNNSNTKTPDQYFKKVEKVRIFFIKK